MPIKVPAPEKAKPGRPAHDNKEVFRRAWWDQKDDAEYTEDGAPYLTRAALAHFLEHTERKKEAVAKQYSKESGPFIKPLIDAKWLVSYGQGYAVADDIDKMSMVKVKP